jgi:hypothetical protein
MNTPASGRDALLKWLSVVLPGLLAGVSWPASEGLPWLNRVAIAVAVGVALYAVIHFAVRAALREPRR